MVKVTKDKRATFLDIVMTDDSYKVVIDLFEAVPGFYTLKVLVTS